MPAILDEHQQWLDTNGKPLVGGKVYFGVQSADPITSPQTIYSDREFTTAISQPQLLDSNGRTTNKVWIKQRYSIRVDDLNDVQQYQSLDNGEPGSVGVTTLDNVAGADTITATASPTITALLDKETYVFKTVSINSGAVTLNIDGIGAVSVVKHRGVALEQGDFAADEIITVIYNATSNTFDIANRDEVINTPNLSLQNGIIQTSVASNALTFSIKTKTGADPSVTDPVKVVFRNVTPATGDFSVVSITAATSLVVSSGSTLGTTSATPFRLWLVGFNDGGTFRLGVINCLSGTNIYPLSGWPVASSTAEGGAGAADSSHVFYTGSAVTSKVYEVLGYASWESGLTTAGTWDAQPTRLHMADMNTAMPGDVVQTAKDVESAVQTGVTASVSDDTIPQDTEGNEYLSQAVTPTSTANILAIESRLAIASTAGGYMVMALFQDSGTSAIAAVQEYTQAAATGLLPVLTHEMLAATTSATTFKIRAGHANGGTTTLNGDTSARRLGGVMSSHLKITEVMA